MYMFKMKKLSLRDVNKHPQNTKCLVAMRKSLPYFQVETVLRVSWQSLTKSTGWENLGSI